MEPILQQVSRARRRLGIEQFLHRLSRCWFVGFFIAAIAIAAPKAIAIENLPALWSILWTCGALGMGLIAAVGWTVWRPQSSLEAAAEIDRRFELRERVASSLSLAPEAAATPAGKALLRDAQRSIMRLDVGPKFPIRLGRRAWLPIVPAMASLVLVLFVDNRRAQSSIDPKPAELTKKELENAAAALRKRLVQQKKEAAEKGLIDAEALLRELEKNSEKLAKTKDLDRKQALVKLNDLSRQLAERRDRLGGGDEELRKQLSGIKEMNKGPAEKMADAMRQGNWNAAKKELEKLQKELAGGKLSDELQKQLEQQLKQLQEKISEAAAAKQQAIDDLKKQISEKKTEGDLAEAGRLQQKLDQMQKQQKQAEQLEKLAQQMAQAQQAMQQGDQKAASEAMQQMMQQMAQMQQELAESDILDAAMEQIEMAKDAMACDKCMGEGCAECQGNGNADMFGDMSGNGMGKGMQQGKGGGSRPDEKNDVRFRDSRVKQNPGRGAAVLVGEADGPNFRGQVLHEIQEEIEAQGSAAADPLVIEQLPKSRRQHVEEYFNPAN